MNRRLALVRRPSPRLADGIVTFQDRVEVDPELAGRQWVGYLRALQSHGWGIVEAPPADDCPDGVFIEDQVFVYGELAVLCRSGALSRRPEQVGLAETMTRLGYQVQQIQDPGTLDGGDVLKHDSQVWVGVGARTNEAGFRQLVRLLTPLGVTCHEVPAGPALHLKSAVTALPDGTLLGWPGALADVRTMTRFLPAQEPEGAHVVLLGANAVLLGQSAPRTAEQLRSRRLDVVTVDISEFEKLEACVTCLSVRLRG